MMQRIFVFYPRHLSLPFTWRYGSPEMRALWSEAHKRRLWRRIWVALAEASRRPDWSRRSRSPICARTQDDVDLERAQAIEAEIHHDLMAEVRTYAEQCPVGGGIIHLGATSMDIEDNADALRIREALDLVLDKLRSAAAGLRRPDRGAGPMRRPWPLPTCSPPNRPRWATAWRSTPRTCWPTTTSCAGRDGMRGKGFKGAVGTSASYVQLLDAAG